MATLQRSASPGRRSPKIVSATEITLHLKQLKILQQPASPVPSGTVVPQRLQQPASPTGTPLSTVAPQGLHKPELSFGIVAPHRLQQSDSPVPSVAPQSTTEPPAELPHPPPIPQPPPMAPLTPVPRLGLSALAQPFAPKPKAFRPISFNPTANKVAQIAM